ncbi:unnamed protein product [Peniophora sp. CBMAI 1063]|nr:unnamed protein product [Peniophora sp. CBMAI 1063]
MKRKHEDPHFVRPAGSQGPAQRASFSEQSSSDVPSLKDHHLLPITLDNANHGLSQLASLERAIPAHQTVTDVDLEATRPTYLAHSFLSRFQCSGQLDDLERAIIATRSSLEDIPGERSYQSSLLADLCNSAVSLWGRAVCNDSSDDLEIIIHLGHQIIDLIPERDPEKPVVLYRLGLLKEAQFYGSRDKASFDAAVTTFVEIAAHSLANPSIRLDAARRFVSLVSECVEFASADILLFTYERVCEIFPEIVQLGHTIAHRYEESAKLGVLVTSAVPAFISCRLRHQAIVWMETGRSLVWSHILSLREKEGLERIHPTLARALHEVSSSLRDSGAGFHAISQTLQPAPSGHVTRSVTDGAADGHRNLVAQYEAIMNEIRGLRGFEDFLRPPTIASYMAIIEHLDGPVVYINVHSSSCDALVLLPNGGIRHVPLRSLKEKEATKLRSRWVHNLNQCHSRVRANGSQIWNSMSGQREFRIMLECLWKWVVEPILGALNLITMSNQLTHITWCPMGPLTQLPLHAAGIYSGERASQLHAFDFVASSYTPSLSALLRCQKQSRARPPQPSVLVIAQPSAPGLEHLPGIQVECQRLRAVIPSHVHVKFLEDKQGTAHASLEAIKQHPWVHIACHGAQNAADPTKSAFALYNSQLTLSALMGTVAEESAELAFLSACQTAVGDQKVPEESAHLAAGILAVGFKGVVATMWSINDATAPVVVETYYRRLFELRSSESLVAGYTGAAYGLHDAVKALRDHVGEQDFVKWAPFVHFGV